MTEMRYYSKNSLVFTLLCVSAASQAQTTEKTHEMILKVRFERDYYSRPAPRKIYVFNQKVKRLTYVNLKEIKWNVFEGAISINSTNRDVVLYYRIGESIKTSNSLDNKKYYSFTYSHGTNELLINLKQDQVPLDQISRVEISPQEMAKIYSRQPKRTILSMWLSTGSDIPNKKRFYIYNELEQRTTYEFLKSDSKGILSVSLPIYPAVPDIPNYYRIAELTRDKNRYYSFEFTRDEQTGNISIHLLNPKVELSQTKRLNLTQKRVIASTSESAEIAPVANQAIQSKLAPSQLESPLANPLAQPMAATAQIPPKKDVVEVSEASLEASFKAKDWSTAKIQL